MPFPQVPESKIFTPRTKTQHSIFYADVEQHRATHKNRAMAMHQRAKAQCPLGLRSAPNTGQRGLVRLSNMFHAHPVPAGSRVPKAPHGVRGEISTAPSLIPHSVTGDLHSPVIDPRYLCEETTRLSPLRTDAPRSRRP
ncbi:hypothetical protein PoB_000382600 [Plakobranchus ocellatus]|uniref:Uncharacterized protein n=1 Tax=Plakobranchus ocellatus TaxID=259542 RepID=A0AAV3Y4J3_9GAST|nr:hypothetical protein PoB_000382600 [Plakobranchus ocellatus]